MNIRRKAAFWSVIGTQIEVFSELFGSKTMGRLRMFAALIDEQQVFDVPFLAKLAARSSSMNYIVELLAWCLLWQQPSQGNPAVQKVKHSREALTVLAALAEATSECLEEYSKTGRKRSVKKWCEIVATLVKFTGKGHGALAVANLACRVGAWSVGSANPLRVRDATRQVAAASVADAEVWLDDTIRFQDALAAAAKIMVHIVNQIAMENEAKEARASGECAPGPGAQNVTTPEVRTEKDNTRARSDTWGHELKVSDTEKADTSAVARKILQGLIATERGRQALDAELDLTGAAGVGRLVYERLHVPKPVWREAVNHLTNVGVFQADGGSHARVKLDRGRNEPTLQQALALLQVPSECAQVIVRGCACVYVLPSMADGNMSSTLLLLQALSLKSRSNQGGGDCWFWSVPLVLKGGTIGSARRRTGELCRRSCIGTDADLTTIRTPGRLIASRHIKLFAKAHKRRLRHGVVVVNTGQADVVHFTPAGHERVVTRGHGVLQSALATRSPIVLYTLPAGPQAPGHFEELYQDVDAASACTSGDGLGFDDCATAPQSATTSMEGGGSKWEPVGEPRHFRADHPLCAQQPDLLMFQSIVWEHGLKNDVYLKVNQALDTRCGPSAYVSCLSHTSCYKGKGWHGLATFRGTQLQLFKEKHARHQGADRKIEGFTTKQHDVLVDAHNARTKKELVQAF